MHLQKTMSFVSFYTSFCRDRGAPVGNWRTIRRRIGNGESHPSNWLPPGLFPILPWQKTCIFKKRLCAWINEIRTLRYPAFLPYSSPIGFWTDNVSFDVLVSTATALSTTNPRNRLSGLCAGDKENVKGCKVNEWLKIPERFEVIQSTALSRSTHVAPPGSSCPKAEYLYALDKSLSTE